MSSADTQVHDQTPKIEAPGSSPEEAKSSEHRTVEQVRAALEVSEGDLNTAQGELTSVNELIAKGDTSETTMAEHVTLKKRIAELQAQFMACEGELEEVEGALTAAESSPAAATQEKGPLTPSVDESPEPIVVPAEAPAPSPAEITRPEAVAIAEEISAEAPHGEDIVEPEKFSTKNYTEATTAAEALADTSPHTEVEEKLREDDGARDLATREVLAFVKGGEDSAFAHLKKESRTLLEGIGAKVSGGADTIMRAYMGEEAFQAEKARLDAKGWTFRPDQVYKALMEQPALVVASLDEAQRSELQKAIQSVEGSVLQNYKTLRTRTTEALALGEQDALSAPDQASEHALTDLTSQAQVRGQRDSLIFMTDLQGELAKSDGDRQKDLESHVPGPRDRFYIGSTFYAFEETIARLKKYPKALQGEALALAARNLEAQVDIVEKRQKKLVDTNSANEIFRELLTGMEAAHALGAANAYARLQRMMDTQVMDLRTAGSLEKDQSLKPLLAKQEAYRASMFLSPEKAAPFVPVIEAMPESFASAPAEPEKVFAPKKKEAPAPVEAAAPAEVMVNPETMQADILAQAEALLKARELERDAKIEALSSRDQTRLRKAQRILDDSLGGEEARDGLERIEAQLEVIKSLMDGVLAKNGQDDDDPQIELLRGERQRLRKLRGVGKRELRVDPASVGDPGFHI